MKDRKPYKRPGKLPVFAELPEELVIAFEGRSERTKRKLRGELEFAMRHWLTLPENFIPEEVDLSALASEASKTAPSKPRGRKSRKETP